MRKLAFILMMATGSDAERQTACDQAKWERKK